MPMRWYLLFKFHDLKNNEGNVDVDDNDDNDDKDDSDSYSDKGWKKVDSIITQYECAQDLIREMFSDKTKKKIFHLDELCGLFEEKLKNYGGALHLFEDHEAIVYDYEDLKCLGIIIGYMKKNDQTNVTIKTYYA